MRRIIILLLAALMTMTVGAQKRNTAKKKSTPTVSKSARKSVASKRTSKKTTKNTVAHSNSSIRGLQKERSQIQKKIRQQEQALRANQADVKKRLQNLMTLNSAIDEIGRASCRERV